MTIVTASILTPCSDAENDYADQQEVSIVQASDHESHTGLDFCPPLCTCCCCHSHTTTTVFLSHTPSKKLIEDLSSFYSDHLSNISLAIWQPPKIA